VSLSYSDRALAARVGQERFDRRRGAGSEHRWARVDEHTAAKEIESIGAEIEAARAIGRDWVDRDSPDHDGDIGPGLQVRHTRYDGGHLILHPEDEDGHVFFLVTGSFPNLTVRGWIRASEGKRGEWWGELQRGRPAFNIPQHRLHRLEEWQ
jgi:hypothetical protein